MRVLYVEDNPDDAELTTAYFDANAPDVRLEVVHSGRACLDRLATTEYDVVLLDYRLPDMDGVDVLKALAGQRSMLPVVVTTAAGDEAIAVEVLRLGAADYVPKAPGYVERLPAALRSAVHLCHDAERRREHSAASSRCIVYVEQHPADIDLTLARLAEVLPNVHVEVIRSGAEALTRIKQGGVDLVLADLRMPQMSALDLLRELRYAMLDLPLIVITGRGDESAAVAAIKLGAADYIIKREEYLTQLPYVIDQTITRHQLARSNHRLQTELTERRRLQEITSESLALLDTLQKHAPIGIAFTDRLFQFQRINDELAAINGLPAVAHIGRTVAETFPTLWPRFKSLFEQALSGQSASTEFVIDAPAHADRARTFVGHFYPIHHEVSGIIGVGVAVAEVTDQKRAEVALREHATVIADASRQKDEFLAMLSHELRNPMTPIRTALELLRRTSELDETGRRALGVLDRQIGHLARLLDDLLEVARITTGRINVRPAPVDLRAVVDESLDSAKEFIDAHGHSVEVVLPPEPLIVNGDLTRLVQVIVNLLNNAAKYTDHGGVIRVEAATEGTWAVLRVTDSGAGISPRLLPKIFDLFTQDERTLDRAQGGLGLGLSVVRRITELHGGSVQARSEGRGRGSEFTVRLPLVGDRMQPAPRVISPAQCATEMRCMVVEDNVDAARMLEWALHLEGHQVRLAFDGREAVDAAAAFRPDVIVLDIGLPYMNGYDAARAIRQLPGLEDVYIVAVTGYGQESDFAKSREAGIDDHLVKPIELDTLLRAVAGRGAATRDTA